ncbi:M56 family metallopeptidase [Thermogutta sp.]|uniref:M56 family metallopeptidase n=1 Tax=Thermogutta sp. TaxID=1962930 RepID=UPI003C7C21F1
MMEAPWQSLAFLALGVTLLVALAALADGVFGRAEFRRLVWISCLAGNLVFIFSLLLGAPFAVWQLVGLLGQEVNSAVSSAPVEKLADEQSLGTASRSIVPPPVNRDLMISGISVVDEEVQSASEVSRLTRPSSTKRERWLLFVWTSGVMLFGGQILAQRLIAAGVSRRSRDLSQTPLAVWVNRMAAQAGYSSPIRIITSPRFVTPVAFGIVRPTIGVPSGFDPHLNSNADKAVLLHELKHILNRDPCWHLVADAVVAVLWWHPAAWFARFQWEKASEEVADEYSLCIPDGPRELAAGLILYGRKALEARMTTPLATAAVRTRSHLAVRVKRLLCLQDEQVAGRSKTVGVSGRFQRWVVWLTAAAVFVASVGATAPQVSDVYGGVRMSWVKWCWRHSLLAAAAAACIGPWVSPTLAEEGRKPDEPVAVERKEERGEREKPRVEREEGERERGVREERERAREVREAPRERPRPPEAGPRGELLGPPALERIERQIAELREQLARAREAGQEERVRDLERQIDRVERIRENIRAGRPPEAGLEPPPVAREAMMRLEQRMRELRERIAQAEREGREELVRELRAEAERVERAMRDLREGRLPPRPFGPPVPVPPERMERARHAAELLRREGFGDMAELLMRAVTGMPPVPPPRVPDVRPPRPESEREGSPPGDRPRGERPPRPERDRPAE